MAIRFFWNGLKIGTGPLQRATMYYQAESVTQFGKVREASIVVNARDYRGFSREVHEAFAVRNDSDVQSDYFDKDSFTITRSHPLWNEAAAAVDKRIARQHAALNRRLKKAGVDMAKVQVVDFVPRA